MQNQQDHTSFHTTQPLVSFIITYYDLPVEMLCECIDSILTLSLRPYEREIIVVDDGSKKSPIKEIMQYGDDIVYVRQKHEGVSIARNTMMRMAKGKYIQFVDGDDAIQQASYEHCLDIIRYSKEEVDMVLFDFTNNKNYEETTNYSPIKTNGSEYMLHHNIHGAAWGYMFRQVICGQLEFTPHVTYGEDEEFTPKLLLRADCIYVTSAKAYYYRKHETSAIQKSFDTNMDQRLDDNKGVIIRLHKLCDKLPQKDRLALQRRIAQLTMDYIYNTIILKRTQQALDLCLTELKAEGLFPLPDRDYSTKYIWFRRMTSSSIGLSLLLHTLPLFKNER